MANKNVELIIKELEAMEGKRPIDRGWEGANERYKNKFLSLPNDTAIRIGEKLYIKTKNSGKWQEDDWDVQHTKGRHDQKDGKTTSDVVSTELQNLKGQKLKHAFVEGDWKTVNGYRVFIEKKADASGEGRWVTVMGRKVFIPEGTPKGTKLI